MEGSQPIRLKIITPEKTVYDEMVNHVVLPGQDGNVGIFYQHIPFMSYLKPGRLQIHFSGKRIINLEVNSGLIEFKDDLLTLLTTEEISQETIHAEISKEEYLKAKEKEEYPQKTPE